MKKHFSVLLLLLATSLVVVASCAQPTMEGKNKNEVKRVKPTRSSVVQTTDFKSLGRANFAPELIGEYEDGLSKARLVIADDGTITQYFNGTRSEMAFSLLAVPTSVDMTVNIHYKETIFNQPSFFTGTYHTPLVPVSPNSAFYIGSNGFETYMISLGLDNDGVTLHISDSGLGVFVSMQELDLFKSPLDPTASYLDPNVVGITYILNNNPNNVLIQDRVKHFKAPRDQYYDAWVDIYFTDPAYYGTWTKIK